MATKSQAGRIIGVFIAAALFLIVVPSRLQAQVAQDGRWSLISLAGAYDPIYTNATSADAKVMVTVCNAKGDPIVNVRVGGTTTNLAIVDPGLCSTLLVSVPASGFLAVINPIGGAPSSGAYSITSPLP